MDRPPPRVLRQRWLGTVAYREAHDLQRALYLEGSLDHLLLLEHPPVYTMGASGDSANILVDPESVGAEFVAADRGGDVTYHGPGQLVGYPILDVAGRRGGGMADTVRYVRSVEQLIIDALADLGLVGAGRLDRHPGVWVDPEGPQPRKIAAVGVRLSRGRSMHGFAVNVDPDLAMFANIVPCGIRDKSVTSLRHEGIAAGVGELVDAVFERSASRWEHDIVERADIVERVDVADLAAFTRGLGAGSPVRPTEHGDPSRVEGLTIGRRAPGARMTARLEQAGVSEGLALRERKPEWLRAKAEMGPEYRSLKRTMRSLDLVTVCEEAACPNIYECWGAGTATFMINGERCTRACGFCHVDTRKPMPLASDEPERVADAVEQMGLTHAVVTAVARDDLDDGGAAAFAATVAAIRSRCPETSVEVLISDCKGDRESLDLIIEAAPDVLNHNIETVARLQRAVRPSAGYARSLSVLARSSLAGLVTKSGLIVGMGETVGEIEATLADLAGVGCDIVTIGQYLRPTTNHLPVHRWVEPDEFDHFARVGAALGIGHVESSPLTRSSYHAADSVRSLGM